MAERPRHLPQLHYPGCTYFVTWRLNAQGDTLSPAERDLVADTLELWHEQRYRLAAYVVMDDHVHVVVHPLGEHTLGSILHSWKSFTASAINKGRGAKGTRWMKDSRTDLLRVESQLRACVQYIVDNPARRWPGVEDYRWLSVFDVL